MKQLSKKTKFLVELFCVIMLILICVSVYLNGISLSCDKCNLRFKQEMSFGVEDDKDFSVKVLDLYEGFKEGECVVEWVKNNGFVYKGEFVFNGS